MRIIQLWGQSTTSGDATRGPPDSLTLLMEVRQQQVLAGFILLAANTESTELYLYIAIFR
jgi:hypothetical protein